MKQKPYIRPLMQVVRLQSDERLLIGSTTFSDVEATEPASASELETIESL